MEFDKEFLGKLLEQAMENPRLRQNFDLRTSSADTSQRMLNALQPQTEVPIHRHEKTSETVICLVGKLEEIIYEEVNEYVHEATSCCDDVIRQKSFKEVSRQILSPAEGKIRYPNTCRGVAYDKCYRGLLLFLKQKTGHIMDMEIQQIKSD